MIVHRPGQGTFSWTGHKPFTIKVGNIGECVSRVSSSVCYKKLTVCIANACTMH